MGELTWRLTDPGMDLLERAGLAALYMTLRAAESESVDLTPMEWQKSDLASDSVTLRWKGTAKEAFKALFRYAWQVRDDVIYAPAIHREVTQRGEPHKRIPLHSGILGTFLQHPRVQPKGEIITRIESIDEGAKSVEYRYQALGGNGLKARKDLDDFFDRKGELRGRVSLSSWVMPGMAPRFDGEGAWIGKTQIALLLMLAPLACLYLRVPPRGTWVLITPDIRDLAEYDDIRPLLTPDPKYADVASIGDAALRFASEYSGRNVRRHLAVDCQVTAMGKVDYYPNQTVRRAIFDSAPSAETISRFRTLERVMPYRYVAFTKAPPTETSVTLKSRKRSRVEAPGPQALGFMKAPSARGRIADNLAADRAWYVDLFAPPPWERVALDRQRKSAAGQSPERIWFRNVEYQRGELMELIKETTIWEREDERILVQACHDGLRALFAKEAKAARSRKGSRSLRDRWDDMKEDLRRNLMHAKTRQMLRGVLSEFFARADYAGKQGDPPPALKQHLPSVWRLLDDPRDWRKARDLSLLALASYVPKPAATGTEVDSAPDGEGDMDSQEHEEIES